MTDIDVNRCLTMAAFSGFIAVRNYQKKNPGLSLHEVIDAVRNTNSDAANLDYIGGAAIHKQLSLKIGWADYHSTLRTVVCDLVKIAQPWWLRLVPYGRDRVRSALGQDQQQCLREAGLFDPNPDSKVIAWWDELAATIRGKIETERMIQARHAERLSIEYERNRLQKIGINLEPEWISLEDNYLGYDIRSYDFNGEYIVGRLIEVKSTTSNNIFISRNEWENAVSAESQYFFYVWKLPEREITVYPVSAIKPNIPINQGNGAWQDVLIVLSS